MTNKQLKIAAQIGGNWWFLDDSFGYKMMGIYLEGLKKAIGISESGSIYITEGNFKAISNAVYEGNTSAKSSVDKASELFRKDLKLKNFI